MKNEQLLFRPDFFQKQINGPGDLARINDLVAMRPASKTAEEILIKDVFPSLPQREVATGLVDMEQEKQALRLQQVLEKTLKPWLITPNLDGTPLPALTALELSRKTGLSISKIVNLIKESPIVIGGQDKAYQAIVEPGKFGASINPKRIIKAARYESRPPGGGPIQRSRLQDKNIAGQIIKFTNERTKITFETFGQGGNSEIETDQAKKKDKASVEWPVRQVVDWFKKQRKKKWILGDNEKLLQEDLSALRNGESVDFVLWNCLDFEWEQDQRGEYPTCALKPGVENSNVCYQMPRIVEMAKVLSGLGKPNLLALVPTNEAFNPKVWSYTQSRDERETLVDGIVFGLNQTFRQVVNTGEADIEAIRWDEYLKRNGIEKDPNEYSAFGEQKIRQSADFPVIKNEAAKNGIKYFRQKGISVKPEIVADKRIGYYGVYAGEGLALTEIRKSGKRVIVVNLEEFRVANMESLGADGKLPIATPISDQEMTDCYRQKNI